MNYFIVWLRFPYQSICKKPRFDRHNIIKVYLFLNSFFQEFYIQKLGDNIKIWFMNEFAQLDKFLKVKPNSGFLCKYEKLKLWHF